MPAKLENKSRKHLRKQIKHFSVFTYLPATTVKNNLPRIEQFSYDKNKIDFVWIFLNGQYTLRHTQLNDMYIEIVNRVQSQIRVIISIS